MSAFANQQFECFLNLKVKKCFKPGDPRFLIFFVQNLSLLFLPRDAMRKRGLCCRTVSVGPSVTLVHCIHMAEDIVKLLCQPDSPIILVLCSPERRYQFPREPLERGRKIQRGGKILRFLIEITANLGNGS